MMVWVVDVQQHTTLPCVSFDTPTPRHQTKEENRAWQLQLEADAAAFAAEQHAAQERETQAQAEQRAFLDAQIQERRELEEKQEEEERAVLAAQQAVQVEFDRQVAELLAGC